MFVRLVGAVLIVPFLSTATLAAENHPSVGMLHHTTENSSITYECSRAGTSLNCDFTQVRVNRKSNREDAARKLDESVAAFMNETKSSFDGTCDRLPPLARLYRGDAQPNGVPELETALKDWNLKSAEEQADALEYIDLLERFCSNRTVSKFKELVALGIRRDSQTCNVSTHSFKQEFKFFPDSRNWIVTQGGPQGSCGVVQVDRFEPADDAPKGVTFWNYVAKKVVTNKQGTGVLFRCDQLDEGEYLYSWRSREIRLGCRYINFTPF